MAAVAVPVESAIAGKRRTLTDTPEGLSGPVLPNLLLDGISRRGPESPLKTGAQTAWINTPLSGWGVEPVCHWCS